MTLEFLNQELDAVEEYIINSSFNKKNNLKELVEMYKRVINLKQTYFYIEFHDEGADIRFKLEEARLNIGICIKELRGLSISRETELMKKLWKVEGK